MTVIIYPDNSVCIDDQSQYGAAAEKIFREFNIEKTRQFDVRIRQNNTQVIAFSNMKELKELSQTRGKRWSQEEMYIDLWKFRLTDQQLFGENHGHHEDQV